jgi:uncharacterized membrane protein (DUF2068 family)
VGVFINLVSKVSDVHLWKIAVVAGIYTAIRFIEAYGLWYLRPWAEWMAIASGTIYIPFEIADLIRRPHWFPVVALTINLGVVFYMLYVRLDAIKKHQTHR